MDIIQPGYPKQEVVDCTSGALISVAETLASDPSLIYDEDQDQYQYNWRTTAAYAGSCRALIFKLKDGGVRSVLFDVRHEWSRTFLPLVRGK